MTGEEATAAVAGALEAMDIAYMLVGSFATNHYGIPRSTQDADFVVQLGAHRMADLVQRLGPGFRLDRQMAFETITATTRYALETPGSPFKIELFLLSDDAHDQERFRRRQSVTSLGRQIRLPTVEDVIVTKLRWCGHANRHKDRDDVRDVIAVQESNIDWPYVYRWAEVHGTRALLDEIRREATSGEGTYRVATIARRYGRESRNAPATSTPLARLATEIGPGRGLSSADLSSRRR